VATLSDAVFQGPCEDQASSRTRSETSSKQAEPLIRGPYGLGQNLPPTQDDIYTPGDGQMAQTLGAGRTIQYANVNVRDPHKRTPLHIALKDGDVGFAQELVEHGADVNAKDNYESTPLHLGSRDGHVESTQVLVKHGANVDAQDNSKSTPLHLALRGGHVEIAQMPIEHGADVKSQDNDKSGPLHLLQTNIRSIDTMSSTRYTVPPTSNFQLITEALHDYAKQTGIYLANHPSAERFELTDSPDAVLRIFQERENAFGKFRNRSRTLINCLRPAVQILHAFSSVIGEAASLVSHTCFVPLSCFIHR